MFPSVDDKLITKFTSSPTVALTSAKLILIPIAKALKAITTENINVSINEGMTIFTLGFFKYFILIL